jgi:multiple sugar transport system ATP-binding protein
MASVDIEEVSKSFGTATVMSGISINIADEEFVVLVGPSGCGKSTLLRMVAGLETVSGGSILIGGRDVTRVPPKDRDIAMVFQSYALYPHMTVYENMAFNLKLRKMDASGIRSRVGEAADILGLSHLLQRYPRQLSGGQRQRVAMGRAIVRNPQVFLFDEPLSNLDAKLRVQMRAEIKSLHLRLRATSVYVTHDQVEAMTLADRIIVMNDGRIEQVGTPLQLYERPRNLFVAGFIGSPAMNFIPARVRRGAGSFAIETDNGSVLPTSGDVGAADGEAVTYGVRPESLAIADDGGMPARVELVEFTGADTLVHADLEGTRICAVFSEHRPFAQGDIVRLRIPAAAAHVFDSAGRRASAHELRAA